jgi:hypothetical protein
MITTRQALGELAASSAASIASSNDPSIAFSTCGRFSVIRRMPSSTTSTSTGGMRADYTNRT